MRRVLSACAGMLLLAAGAPPAHPCSMVEVINYQPSSQNAVITVLKDETPQRGVEVDVYIPGEEPRVKLVTDVHGTVHLPRLPSTRYCLRAWVGFELEAYICLEMSTLNKTASAFSMNLAKPRAPLFEVSVQAAESRPPSAHVKEFSGVVKDPVGAVIPRAEVEVGPIGDRDPLHAIKSKTDDFGRFAVDLTPGVYTALFKSSGFRTYVLVFEVVPNGSSESLQIKMDLGGCST